MKLKKVFKFIEKNLRIKQLRKTTLKNTFTNHYLSKFCFKNQCNGSISTTNNTAKRILKKST